MKVDGVVGRVSASQGETTLADLSVVKPLDGHPAGILLGDDGVRGSSPYDGGVNLASWGLDRVDMSADAGPFFAYGDGFLGGVDVPVASAGIVRLEIIYAPLVEQGVGGLALEVPDVEANGPHMLMTAGFLF
jgi:hypothetical protein